MGKYLRGPVEEQLALGTLATRTLVRVLFASVVNERTLISSLVARFSLSGFTPIDNAGPILVGIAHSDYTAGEIEEFLEGTGGWNETDQIGQERAKRKIRRIGLFDVPGSAGESVSLNDGKAIKTKLNWILSQGETLALWAYNTGGSSLATTDPDVGCQGHANLWPR